MKNWLPVLALLAGFGCSISFAQFGIIDCIQQRRLVVPRVHGQVLDSSGVPVSGAVVSLTPDGNPAMQTKTDSMGRFDFKASSGSYVLKAEYPGFEITTAELEVGKDALNTLHPTALRVILGLPGINCPWVTTSNKEYKELIQKHATQK
jgi:hypothetical protein